MVYLICFIIQEKQQQITFVQNLSTFLFSIIQNTKCSLMFNLQYIFNTVLLYCIIQLYMKANKSVNKKYMFQEAVKSFKTALDLLSPKEGVISTAPEAAEIFHLIGLCYMRQVNLLQVGFLITVHTICNIVIVVLTKNVFYYLLLA